MSGVVLTPPAGAQLLAPTAVKTSAYSASPGDFVPVDTTSGAVTVTLPNAPADGTRVAVKMVVQGGTNTVSVVCAGSDVFNKAGGVTTATLTLVSQAISLQYKSSSGIWYVVGDDMPLSGLDARYLAAATAYERAATYHLVARVGAAFSGSGSAVTRFLTESGLAQQVTNASVGLAIFRLDPAWFTDGSLTRYLRLRASLMINDTAPSAGDWTWGLYPVTAVSGATGNIQMTVGAVVAASVVTITSPAADSMNAVVGSDFAHPAAGWYAIGMATQAYGAAATYATRVAVETRAA